MKYRTLVILGGCVVIGLVGYAVFMGRGVQDRIGSIEEFTAQEPLPDSLENVTVLLGDQEVTLAQGVADVHKDGAVLRVEQGGVVEGDLTGDGVPEKVFLLTVTREGVVIATYLAAAISSDLGFLGTNGIPLPSASSSSTTVQVDYGMVTVQQGPEFTLYAVLVDTLLDEVVVDTGSVYTGAIQFLDDEWIFTSCEENDTRSVSPDSPSFAAIQAIYTARSLHDTPLFITMVATEQSISDLLVSRIISVPTAGVCSAVSTHKKSSTASTTVPDLMPRDATTTSRI
jgi:hypothetical protein